MAQLPCRRRFDRGFSHAGECVPLKALTATTEQPLMRWISAFRPMPSGAKCLAIVRNRWVDVPSMLTMKKVRALKDAYRDEVSSGTPIYLEAA
jgi:hypothetical protein